MCKSQSTLRAGPGIAHLIILDYKQRTTLLNKLQVLPQIAIVLSNSHNGEQDSREVLAESRSRDMQSRRYSESDRLMARIQTQQRSH